MELSRVEQIYDEIFTMGIELEPDPTVLGPRYLNGVISTCRNFLNRVTSILLEIQREKRGVANALAAEKAGYQVALSQLLAENQAIKAAPNIKDREAQANVLLNDRVVRINALEHQVLDLDTIEKAVKLRHQELVRTSDNIKTQRSLLIADRVSGAGYGDEFDGPRDSKGRALPPEDDGIDEAEIARIMARDITADGVDEGEAEPVVETKPEAKPALEPEPVVEAKKPESVVEAKPEPKPEPAVAKPEPTPEPVETKTAPDLVPDPMDAILAEVAMETEVKAAEPPKAQESAPETALKTKAEESPIQETSTPIAESEVATFLDKEEASKVNGSTTKTEDKAKKKKDEPKVQKSAPADGDTDYDFSDILKSL